MVFLFFVLWRCYFSLNRIFFSFNCKTGTRLDIFWKEREPSYSVFCYRETLESQITRKVLLHQMWGVKWLAHLPFPIYNTLVISQQVHSDSAPKLYLVYLAGQLHIQASHLLTVEMFLNWGLFIPGTARDCPLYTYINKYIYIYTFFPHLDYCDSVPLCSFWKMFLPPYNSSKMLQQCLKEKWSPLQLPVSFRIDFLRFYFHGSAGYVLWLSQSLKSCAS